MREFPEPGSCEALADGRTRKRNRTSPGYDAWRTEGEKGWKRAPISPPRLTTAMPAVDTPATIARTWPPDRKRSRSGGGDCSAPAKVGGDALCPTASPSKRHTPPAKETSVIRSTEVTPYACGESCEDQGMTAARDKSIGGPGEEDGRRCLPGGEVGAAGGNTVAVTPLERHPQMPDPESMRKCLDEYMEVRCLRTQCFCFISHRATLPDVKTIGSRLFNCTDHVELGHDVQSCWPPFEGCRERLAPDLFGSLQLWNVLEVEWRA